MSANSALAGLIILGTAFAIYNDKWSKIWNEKSASEYTTIAALGVSSSLFPKSQKISDGLLKLYVTVKIIQVLKELQKK